MKLSIAQRKVLLKMKEGEELINEKGAGWWIGLRRTNGRLVYNLLRMCAISQDTFSKDNYQIFNINETGRKLLEDKMPHYIGGRWET